MKLLIYVNRLDRGTLEKHFSFESLNKVIEYKFPIGPYLSNGNEQ